MLCLAGIRFDITVAATCSVYSMNNSSRNGLSKAFISALTSKIHFVPLFIQHNAIGDWEKTISAIFGVILHFDITTNLNIGDVSITNEYNWFEVP